MTTKQRQRYLICGSRNWTDRESIREYIEQLPNDSIIITGGCRGVDKIAEHEAKRKGLEVIVFMADWKKYGRSAGPIRNERMLVEGKPNCVVAFHNDFEKSKGTLDMITRTVKADKIPIEIYNLDQE